MRATREKRRAAGKCTRCGKRKARPGKANCKKCNDNAKATVKASRAKKG
jgi:uncharacterized OB-fold protein